MEETNIKKINYDDSSFIDNVFEYGKESFSCCVVIPFDYPDFKGLDVMNLEENKITDFNYDKILITKEDYKKLIKKSNEILTERKI